MTFHWRADDGPALNAGLVFRGSGSVLPTLFFQGGPDPLPPISGSAHAGIGPQKAKTCFLSMRLDDNQIVSKYSVY